MQQILKPLFGLVVIGLTAVGLAQAAAQEPYTCSTFHCLSIYWSRPQDGPCTVEFRKAGEPAWQKAQNLWYDCQTGTKLANQYRGSIVNLIPGTPYEIRLKAGNDTKTVRASTWSENFPIKKTIHVESGAATFKTSEGGSEREGYVLYDGTGQTLDLQTHSAANGVHIRHSYVILRGLTITGAGQYGVIVEPGLSNVVVENCDISGWGRLESRPDKKTKFVPPAADRVGHVEDAGVGIALNCVRVVVQRCRIHHPRYRAAVWNEYPKYYDGHPNGAKAVLIGKHDKASWEANHVIRYNELYSEPGRPYDDVIGGWLNYSKTGVPGADSDIYGNIIMHAADDLIEADGGGQNVRIWGNYLDSCYTPVSFQSLTVGPAYFFRNVIGRGIKTIEPEQKPTRNIFKLVGNNPAFARNAHYGAALFCGPLYVYHNTSLIVDDFGFHCAFSVHPADHTRNVVSRNNVFMTSGIYLDDIRDPANFVDCSFDYDLHNGAVQVNHPVAGADAHGITALAQWRDGHGPSAPPPLKSQGTGQYQLAPGSAGHNRGVALDNFNRGAGDEGGVPDMGAHEAGSPEMRFGTTAQWNP